MKILLHVILCVTLVESIFGFIHNSCDKRGPKGLKTNEYRPELPIAFTFLKAGVDPSSSECTY